jgi:hypothetical protein
MEYVYHYKTQYTSYGAVQIVGTMDYLEGVNDRLNQIERLPDGKKLLRYICAHGHQVEIHDTDDGNACARLSDAALPPLSLAIHTKDTPLFARELKKAVDKAIASKVMTLEHIAGQLATGMTPASYVGKDNVVRPSQKAPAPQGASPQKVMSHAGEQKAAAVSILKEAMAGKLKVEDLPAGWGWDYDLPRLLRNYLTPGTGSASKVWFNHEKTFSCKDDPAMHKRPPAIGLAHELIHALHNSTGMNMALVKKGDEKIEEVITTGMAPYHYEELSDNKLRSQWPARFWSSPLSLRENY